MENGKDQKIDEVIAAITATLKPGEQTRCEKPARCTKPICNCLDLAELKAGGPVKSYPCLAGCEDANEEKAKAQAPATAGELEYKFCAELSAGVVFADDDFAMILEVAARHYDGKVNNSVCVGGFLYGYKNRRDFSDGEDKTVFLNQSQLNLVMKTLEFERTDRGQYIRGRLVKIFFELQRNMEAINKAFGNE